MIPSPGGHTPKFSALFNSVTLGFSLKPSGDSSDSGEPSCFSLRVNRMDTAATSPSSPFSLKRQSVRDFKTLRKARVIEA